MPALCCLNEQLLERAERPEKVPRWCGMRRVAARASMLMHVLAACQSTASAASGR